MSSTSDLTLNTLHPKPHLVSTLTLPPSLSPPTTQTLQTLQTIHSLLHLLHHRNKNQHRHSKWYVRFSVLRREFGKLCSELGVLPVSGFKPWGNGLRDRRAKLKSSRNGTEHKLREVDKKRQQQQHHQNKNKNKNKLGSGDLYTSARIEGRRRAELRVNGWVRTALVERCFVAFTSLLHTPSFTPLALVLVAVLARIGSVTGVTGYLEKQLEREKEEEEREADEKGVVAGLRRAEKADVAELVRFDRKSGDDEDVGVVVQRDELVDGSALAGGLAEAAETVGVDVEDATVPRKKKRRKKGANAIDDIFAGFI